MTLYGVPLGPIGIAQFASKCNMRPSLKHYTM